MRQVGHKRWEALGQQNSLPLKQSNIYFGELTSSMYLPRSFPISPLTPDLLIHWKHVFSGNNYYMFPTFLIQSHAGVALGWFINGHLFTRTTVLVAHTSQAKFFLVLLGFASLGLGLQELFPGFSDLLLAKSVDLVQGELKTFSRQTQTLLFSHGSRRLTSHLEL